MRLITAFETGDLIVPKSEGLDRVDAAIREALKTPQLLGPAFGSITVSSVHCDDLIRGTAPTNRIPHVRHYDFTDGRRRRLFPHL
jgi:hypothetical protein